MTITMKAFESELHAECYADMDILVRLQSIEPALRRAYQRCAEEGIESEDNTDCIVLAADQLVMDSYLIAPNYEYVHGRGRVGPWTAAAWRVWESLVASYGRTRVLAIAARNIKLN